MTLPKLILFLTLPLYILDQVTKFWTVAKLMPGEERIVIENFFHLVRVHNQGVAFGFGNGTAWAPIVFTVVPIIALTLIRVFWKKGVFHHPLSKIAVALLLCGIFGNLTDRLVQGFLLEDFKHLSLWERLGKGYVVDFLDFTLPFINYHWPSFNVADSCICIAAALLFISGLRDEAGKSAKS